MKGFNGKVALVTGSTSGIGKFVALGFAREGAKVVVTGRRVEKGNEVVKEIKDKGGEAVFIKTDVSNPDEIKGMVSKTIETYGRLDFAVNNAGIGGDVLINTADQTLENWNEVIKVNLTAVWLCMKYEIPEIIKQGGGAIVNTSSVYGLVGDDVGHVAYCASKHGIIGITKTAAIEYAKDNLRVNAVCPGWTHSELVDPAIEAMPEAINDILTRFPMGRIAETEEVSELFVWLCSDSSTFITGQAIAPDGGWTTK